MGTKKNQKEKKSNQNQSQRKKKKGVLLWIILTYNQQILEKYL